MLLLLPLLMLLLLLSLFPSFTGASYILTVYLLRRIDWIRLVEVWGSVQSAV
jgi:hypothetical protein